MMNLIERVNPPDPVTQSVFLQEFFGEIFEITLRERDVGSHGDFRVA
jgi:hypothetical protein